MNRMMFCHCRHQLSLSLAIQSRVRVDGGLEPPAKILTPRPCVLHLQFPDGRLNPLLRPQSRFLATSSFFRNKMHKTLPLLLEN